MNLVIVESPTKARTIGRFLGKDYQIEASMGHLVDLPKSKLGVDVEHNFIPQYELVLAKEEIIKRLKDEAKKAQKIILATDPDREGEAIASHIKDVLGSSAPFQRIAFHEITESAIKEALDNPRDIDTNLVNAQTARRVLDRLVGYKLSPLLWMKVRRGLSAGRVQSIALRLIVEREREIEKFKITSYSKIKALFKEVWFDLEEINGDLPAGRQGKVEIFETHQLYDGEYRVSKSVIDSQEKAEKILEDVKKPASSAGGQQFAVSDVLEKEVRRTPPPPFTTSTLQQEAARRLGFSGKKTMTLAQKLYEGGLITYHRTDSVNIASQALFNIRDFIKKEFGEKFLPEKPRFYKTKQKLAQEAHEAIRPTHVGELQTQIAKLPFGKKLAQGKQSQIGNDTVRLYELVWRRAVASQMAEAVIESTVVYVDSVHPRGVHSATSGVALGDSPEVNFYRFKATGSVLIFEGFLKVNPQALEDKKLPKFKVSDLLDLQSINAEIHETQSPPRYNYASLVATLEEKGIGRPSTYAPIIETIENRRYIERQENRFIPTPVGIAVNDFLVANFSDIDDIPFTAEMEDSLDAIAHGTKKWEPVIRDFYIPFEKKFEVVKKAKRVEIAVEKSDQICEKCGSPMVIRMGRFGRFLSCSQFPKCDFKKALVQETNLICPKDKGKIIIKKTRRGRKFYGCYNYPKCDFAAWKLSDITSSKTKR